MEALACLAFPLSLKVHVDVQCLSMYYHRDPPDDPHHPVDPIPEKRLGNQQEKQCIWIQTLTTSGLEIKKYKKKYKTIL